MVKTGIYDNLYIDITLITESLLDYIKVIFTLISITLIFITTFSSPDDIVVVAFICYSMIVFSSVIVLKLNKTNVTIYLLYALSDLIIGVTAYINGADFGVNLFYGILLFISIIVLSLVIIYGRKHIKFSIIVNVVITLVANIPLFIYYIGENSASQLYIVAVLFGIVALFFQLIFVERFFKNLKLNNIKNQLFNSAITLEWIILNILALPILIF